MSALIFLFFAVQAHANWDVSWQKQASVEWRGTKPETTDSLGLSIYCGFASYSKGTRILLTLQNRGSMPIRLEPLKLVRPSEEMMKRANTSLPPVRVRLSRMALHNLSAKEVFNRVLESDVSCRVLGAKEHLLPDFSNDPGQAACLKEHVEIEPGEVYEASYSYKVLLVQLDDFSLDLPGKAFHFRCLEREGSSNAHY